MNFNDKELVKSLTSLIDDTLQEIEEIKKSKFAASEIKIEGPGEGIAGKPVNGDLHAKKAEDSEEEHEEEEHEEEEHEEEEKKPKMKKAEEDDEEESEEDEKEDMKKSLAYSEELIKSYIDDRFSYLDERLTKMASVIESLANAPIARKGVPANVQPLHKSTEETNTLSKSNVIDRLFELKKSGTYVDSSDMFKLETSKNYNEVLEIANKYGVK